MPRVQEGQGLICGEPSGSVYARGIWAPAFRNRSPGGEPAIGLMPGKMPTRENWGDDHGFI